LLGPARHKLIAGDPVELQDGTRVDTAEDPTTRLRDLAKRYRSETNPRPRRGKTTTPEERHLCARAQQKLRAVGMRDAKIEPRATKPGQPSNVRIMNVPLARLEELGQILVSVSGK